jgi:anti-sigma regulatory factor (Ser/Thr protein kinase)
MISAVCVPVTDSTFVGEARRAAADFATRLDFSVEQASNLAIVTTELATNILKHASSGEIVLTGVFSEHRTGVDVVALDKGPGISSIAASLRDGYSTAGSPGTGLGAISRLADSFDLYTQPGRGTALSARLWSSNDTFRDRSSQAGTEAIEIGGLSVPVRGETVSGDAWSVRRLPQGTAILVIDGLGHGYLAAEAAKLGVEIFLNAREQSPVELLKGIHGALQATRGAAGAIAALDPGARQVRFAGIGNISASVITVEDARNLVSMNGILGHEARGCREFTYPWPAGAALLLHSDGITARMNLAEHPGLLRRTCTLMAGVLYRDYNRGRDDATVVVARERTAA